MSSESSVSSPSRVPVGVDATRPSIARIYDGFLGGKTNYAVDRAVMDKVSAAVPEAIDIAKGNRRFLNRACRLLSSQTGITQYLDCGSGLPTAENTHEVVQRANPDASVVYVDNDPVVLAHGRALLEDNDLVHMVEADIFDPPRCWRTRWYSATSTSPSRSCCCRSRRCTTSRATPPTS